MTDETFLLDLPSDQQADTLFAAVGRVTALGSHFESGCKALVALLEVRGSCRLESKEDLVSLVTEVFARRLHGNVSFLSKRLTTATEVGQILNDARESRNAVAHDSTLGFRHFLDQPDLAAAQFAELYEHAHRIAEGIRFVDYSLAVLTNEPLPSARVLLDYPDRLAGWACRA